MEDLKSVQSCDSWAGDGRTGQKTLLLPIAVPWKWTVDKNNQGVQKMDPHHQQALALPASLLHRVPNEDGNATESDGPANAYAWTDGQVGIAHIHEGKNRRNKNFFSKTFSQKLAVFRDFRLIFG